MKGKWLRSISMLLAMIPAMQALAADDERPDVAEYILRNAGEWPSAFLPGILR